MEEDINNYWDNSRYKLCTYAEKLLNELILLNTKVKQPIDIDEVKKGIYYAKKYHGSQMRRFGEPYYSHPIEVAYMVAQYTALEIPQLFRTDMIVTALLHNTIEDTALTKKMIEYIFGSKVANQVEDLTRIKPYGKISSAETLNLLVQQKKYDVALIKIFDRKHNLQTIGAKSPEKAKKIIQETMGHFVTLCAYLEIPKAEQELIKLCQQYLCVNPYELQKQKNFPFWSNNHLFSLVSQNNEYYNKKVILEVT